MTKFHEYRGDHICVKCGKMNNQFTRITESCNEWISLGGFIDPPPTPKGYKIEVKYDAYIGFVTHYRFIKND